MNLRHQIQFLAVVPAVLVAVILGSYVLLQSQSAGYNAAEATAQRLARETGLEFVSGAPAAFERLAREALEERHVAHVWLENREGTVIARAAEGAIPERLIIATAAVIPPGSTGPVAWVRVGTPPPEKAGAGLVLLMVATAVVCLLAILAARHFSDHHERALQRVRAAVDRVRGGHFGAPLATRSPGALGRLEQSVRDMASAMHGRQRSLQEQIDQSTLELRETLEEVEIKNVELDLARKRAVGANRAKSEFLANMSHEIRTPMNAVVGYTQLLARTSLDEDQTGYLELIQHSSDSLLGLIEDILDLSRMEAGKLAIHPREFSLRECVGQIAEMMTPSAYRKGLGFYCLVDIDVPDMLVGDALRIRQILINLLSNAIKFTSQGEIRLRLRKRQHSGGRIVLDMEIADTGIGISDADREALFQPFSRIIRGSFSDASGTGLGLAICKKLCEAMQGTIVVDSQPGAGSRFVATLPLDIANPSESLLGAAALSASRLLLCASDAELRDHLAMSLRADGALVNAPPTSDAIEAVVENGGSAIDAILLVLDRIDKETLERLSADVAGRAPTLVLAATADRKLLRQVAQSVSGAALPGFASDSMICDQLLSLLHRPTQDSTSPKTERRPARSSIAGLNVLIAEDNRVSREYLSILLRQHRVNVDVCEDGNQAVEKALSRSYDLILMDVRMPGKNGMEATRLIRADPQARNTPVIAVTASALPEEQRRIIDAGMNECLVKPVKEERLIALIERWASGEPTERLRRVLPEESRLELDAEMLTLLRTDLPQHAQKIHAALKSTDYEFLREEAHRINGTASFCGFDALRAAAEELETSLRRGETRGIERRVGAVDACIGEVVRRLL